MLKIATEEVLRYHLISTHENLELTDPMPLSARITRFREFHEFKDYWDIDGQVDSVFTNTDIALSPNVIFGSQLIYKPISSEKYGDVELALISKYVAISTLIILTNMQFDAYSKT